MTPTDISDMFNLIIACVLMVALVFVVWIVCYYWSKSK